MSESGAESSVAPESGAESAVMSESGAVSAVISESGPVSVVTLESVPASVVTSESGPASIVTPESVGLPESMTPESVGPASTAVLQAVVSQSNGAHALVTAAGQEPAPLQLAAAVCLPAVQLALRHDVLDEGYAHAVRLTPSQAPPQEGVPLPSPEHAGRVVTAPECGAAASGVGLQTPGFPATSHASHWPVQALSQQRPSTQKFEVHPSFFEQPRPFATLP